MAESNEFVEGLPNPKCGGHDASLQPLFDIVAKGNAVQEVQLREVLNSEEITSLTDLAFFLR